jgi:ATP-dependent helicase/nuclease subunit A
MGLYPVGDPLRCESTGRAEKVACDGSVSQPSGLMKPTPVQEQAISARGNVLVAAGAGTGKTSTLVQRCLALLEQGGSLEQILMVTFTEAAAVEMRGRIREALLKRLARLQDQPDAGGQIEHFQKQVALLDSAMISTLHSFCMRLVREHFFELGVDPEVSVLDEQQTRPLIRLLMDQLFERHYAGQTPAAPAVQRLVQIQGRGSDETIRKVILRLHRYSQSLSQPAEWIRRERQRFQESEPRQWTEWFVEGFVEWRDRWTPVLSRHEQHAVIATAISVLAQVPASPSRQQIAAALESIQAADADTKKWQGAKTEVRKPLKGFFDDLEFLLSLCRSPAALQEDWDLVRIPMLTLLDLAEEFGTDFAQAKREMGGVDFADLEQFALRVLRDPETDGLTPAAREWQRQLEYVFVDEYQDINAAQDAILCAVSREGSGSNRFLVGDVKQSIYRFRLADPVIFRNYERDWASGAGTRIPLTDNFRSHADLLGFVNPLFASLMRNAVGGVEYEALQAGLARTGETRGPRVELHLLLRDGSESESGNGTVAEAIDVADLLATEREARLVALQLRRLKNSGQPVWDKGEERHRPVEWRDMAVLLRSPASRVEAFAKEFSRLGIPLEAARGGFFESPEISDLISLLKLLDNPLQDIPLLAVLHSPMVGMSLEEMAEVRAFENPDRRARYFWTAAQQMAAVQDDPSDTPAARSARARLKQLFDQLQRWRELIRHSSLSHCLETALAESHYEILLRAGPRGEQRLANVRRLVEMARDYDPAQRQGLFRFLRFVKAQEDSEMELEPAGATVDAVRLTSIHRSKGLEFPVVVVAGLGCTFNERDLNDNILLDARFGLCPRVFPHDSDQSYPSLPFWLARQRQRREMLGEELRLLYVAMTRARDRLLLTGIEPRKNAGRWLCDADGPLSDLEISAARAGLDWLLLWLPQVTKSEQWSSDREGASELLQWTLYEPQDSRLSLPSTAEKELKTLESIAPLNADEVARWQARMNWVYPLKAATVQRAKASVTELRRREMDEESGAAPYLRKGAFPSPNPGRKRLTAAEAGVAHHQFLQWVSLKDISSASHLKSEVQRLKEAGWLSDDEVEVLDLAAMQRFWDGELGREIASRQSCVQRELPFTARLSAADLASLGLQPNAQLAPDEMVVVQGVVDLAVIQPQEIWIVDFKTDAIRGPDLDARVEKYRPQLRLYAHALSRIYNRPVTRAVLYFLSLHTAAEV